MKKTFKLLIILFLFSSFQQNWVSKIKQEIDEINAGTTLKKEFENKHENGKENFMLFKDDSNFLIQYTNEFDKYFSFTQSFYKKENLIIAEITYGLIPILYKKERKKDEPYGYLIHRVKYFKSAEKGVKKEKIALYYENQDIEGLKMTLSELNHVEYNLNNTAYLETASQYKEFIKKF